MGASKLHHFGPHTLDFDDTDTHVHSTLPRVCPLCFSFNKNPKLLDPLGLLQLSQTKKKSYYSY